MSPGGTFLFLLREGGSSPATAVVGRDTHVLRDVQARLAALNVFDGVHRFGPKEWDRPSEAALVAFVEPDRFEDLDDADDDAGPEFVRRLHFKLTLLVRDADPVARTEKLDWLNVQAANALDGVSLAGICDAAFTALSQGRYLPARPPDRMLELRGECQYRIGDYDGRDSSNTEGY